MINATASLPELLGSLQEYMPYLQILEYIFIASFLGGIAIKGFKVKVRWYVKTPLVFSAGFLSLFFGQAVSPFLPFLKNSFIQLFQLDLVISGAIGAILVAISLYMMTHKKHMLKYPGAVVIIALIVISIVGFRGLPSIADDISAYTGISADDLKPAQAGCVSPLILAAKYGTSLSSLPQYADDKIKGQIESSQNLNVALMYKVDYKDKPYVLAIALPKGENLTGQIDTSKATICVANMTSLCSCSKVPAL